MDFTLSPEYADAARLARTVLEARCTQGRLREVELTGIRHDAALWRELGSAGLLGLHLPEPVGGAGLGLLELCAVVVEAGRAVAPTPLPAHAAATGALVRFGTPAMVREWVPAAVAGASVLTAALAEDHADAPGRPTTTAEATSSGWRVTGTKTVVPAATVADLFLVPVDTPEGVRVLLVRPDDPGVHLAPQEVNDGDTTARLELEGTPLPADRLLGGPTGEDVVRWLADHVGLLTCAEQLGVVEGALELTAEYARTREQFGRPIGTFQAVSQRLADGYIAVQALRLTTLQAAWRLGDGLPADVEVATARLWAAETGHTVAHTTVHVHGGVGIDLDGPAHRYFTAAKRRELAVGGTTRQALAVGRALAAESA